jgi:hypothetical protein
VSERKLWKAYWEWTGGEIWVAKKRGIFLKNLGNSEISIYNASLIPDYAIGIKGLDLETRF